MISDVQTRARQPGAGEAARDGLIAAVTGEEMDPSIEAIIDLLSRNKGPDFRTRARTALIGQSVARCSAIGDQYRKIIFRLESTPSDLAAVNDIEIPRCTVVDTEVMTAAEGVEQPTADQAVTESPAAGDSQPPPVQEITAEVVGTTEPPATPAIISPSQTSTKAPDEPVDPCVFMDPNALIVDKAGDYCNGEYSVEPYIGITISRIDDNVDMDSYCQAYYEDEYTQVLEEMNLGECGYISLFNDFEPNPDLSFHSGWEISFVFHQYRVTAYTRDQYASNRSALERMATSIEASIGDYYESD
jgi:hypothetical protein